MTERMGAEGPIKLHTVVQYWGERALIVGRSKPIGSPWQYDLLISRDGHLVVVPGLLAEEFGGSPAGVPAPEVAAAETSTARLHN